MERNGSYDFMALGLIVVLFIIMQLIDNQTVKNMDVYISKSKQTIPNHLAIVRKELESFNVIEYLGGKYSDVPLKSSNVVVTILNENTDNTIGRGQFDEIRIAQKEGISVIAIFINDKTIEVYLIDEMIRIEGGDWTNYADISIEDLAVYQIGEDSFKDFIENLQ